ncbi:hypothetical protein CHS0354_014233 [Potamilus streckersoni]|uniref:Methyltransferase domain-containing protein n=1 Tax=Potamilus streckersoni TaxID=2493646 RepID=A0AAE0SB24_9BIVA|nr:hypothetical protein CHS0354_014233 [Potamilus streckersoni]
MKVPYTSLMIEEIPDVSCNPDNMLREDFVKDFQSKDDFVIPSLDRLNQMNHEELSAMYHRYINNLQYLCKKKVRMGLLEDGGWEVCAESKYQPPPLSSSGSNSSCLIYSVGINNDFSFDDDMVKFYRCEVHSFDPSMKQEDFRRSDLDYFYKLGLSGREFQNNLGWKMMTLQGIRKMLNHTQRKIDVLKIDIERSEWEALPEMLQSGVLKQVRQLSIELHLHIAPPQHKDVPRAKYLQALDILRQLYQEGFRIFWTHPNPSCMFLSKCRNLRRANCHEVNFLKVS